MMPAFGAMRSERLATSDPRLPPMLHAVVHDMDRTVCIS
jgi:hypothetical protein